MLYLVCVIIYFLFIYLFFLHLQGSLLDLIEREGMLCESATKHYTEQILEGLIFLHSRHVMHWDLKGGFPLVW